MPEQAADKPRSDRGEIPAGNIPRAQADLYNAVRAAYVKAEEEFAGECPEHKAYLEAEASGSLEKRRKADPGRALVAAASECEWLTAARSGSLLDLASEVQSAIYDGVSSIINARVFMFDGIDRLAAPETDYMKNEEALRKAKELLDTAKDDPQKQMIARAELNTARKSGEEMDAALVRHKQMKEIGNPLTHRTTPIHAVNTQRPRNAHTAEALATMAGASQTSTELTEQYRDALEDCWGSVRLLRLLKRIQWSVK